MFKPVRKLQEGFTLIELLIVIAVIGILATAVLSAINPIEQIKKGRDTTKKSDAAEFLNSVERYYTTFEEYPWDAVVPVEDVSTPQAISSITGSTGELVAKNEIKPQFQSRQYLDELYVTEETGTTNLVHVCFLPESATFQAQAVDQDLQRNGQTAGCVPGAGDATDCHVCLPQ